MKIYGIEDSPLLHNTPSPNDSNYYIYIHTQNRISSARANGQIEAGDT